MAEASTLPVENLDDDGDDKATALFPKLGKITAEDRYQPALVVAPSKIPAQPQHLGEKKPEDGWIPVKTSSKGCTVM